MIGEREREREHSYCDMGGKNKRLLGVNQKLNIPEL